jgi:hypothetical protein
LVDWRIIGIVLGFDELLEVIRKPVNEFVALVVLMLLYVVISFGVQQARQNKVNPENSPNFPPEGLTNCKILKNIPLRTDQSPHAYGNYPTCIWIRQMLQWSG